MKLEFNLSEKYNQMALIIAGGVVLEIIVVLLLVMPAWRSLQQLGTEIPQAQQQKDQREQDLANLQNAKSFFEENQQSVEEVNTAVPIEPEVPSILVILESLAKQNGVFLTSFSPQQAGTQQQAQPTAGAQPSAGQANLQAGPAGVDSVEITANFRGPYSSLINFLYSLERSLRLVDVKTLTVSSTSGVLEGNISFRAYYKKVEGGPQPTTGTTPAPAPTAGGTR